MRKHLAAAAFYIIYLFFHFISIHYYFSFAFILSHSLKMEYFQLHTKKNAYNQMRIGFYFAPRIDTQSKYFIYIFSNVCENNKN